MDQDQERFERTTAVVLSSQRGALHPLEAALQEMAAVIANGGAVEMAPGQLVDLLEVLSAGIDIARSVVQDHADGTLPVSNELLQDAASTLALVQKTLDAARAVETARLSLG